MMQTLFVNKYSPVTYSHEWVQSVQALLIETYLHVLLVGFLRTPAKLGCAGSSDDNALMDVLWM